MVEPTPRRDEVLVPGGAVRVFADPSADVLGPLFASDATDSAIVVGDAQQVLPRIPADTFQIAVTSPPYWSLRDYHIPGQIGLEKSPDAYIASLVAVFEEVRRVLRPDGTLWLNVGDSYTSGGRTWRAPDKKNRRRAMSVRPPTPAGLKPKDLIGIPWRLAFALQAAGWYLRADLLWVKPNAQPESVKDRPTRAHEFMFLFSKAEQYHYDAQAVRGPNNRNLRTTDFVDDGLWHIHTQGGDGEHGAVFPPALVQRCLALGSRRGDLVLDPFLGTGTAGVVAVGMGRRFIGVELNAAFAEKAVRRLGGPLFRV